MNRAASSEMLRERKKRTEEPCSATRTVQNGVALPLETEEQGFSCSRAGRKGKKTGHRVAGGLMTERKELRAHCPPRSL